jgi:MFS superfamily sulfate permease-like transporter
MLPASELAEILTNLSALKLDPTIAAAVLGALAPLLRSSANPQLEDLPGDPRRPRKRAGRPRLRGGPSRRKKYKRRAARPSEVRERARAALQAKPGATVSAVAKLAKVSFGTVINARKDLAKEAHREARRKSRTTETAKSSPATSPKREWAQKWLRDTLAQGPKEVQVVEAAAAKAHIDDVLLSQARADLGIVTSRANTGGAHAVQWSLPG